MYKSTVWKCSIPLHLGRSEDPFWSCSSTCPAESSLWDSYSLQRNCWASNDSVAMLKAGAGSTVNIATYFLLGGWTAVKMMKKKKSTMFSWESKTQNYQEESPCHISTYSLGQCNGHTKDNQEVKTSHLSEDRMTPYYCFLLFWICVVENQVYNWPCVRI